MDTVTKSLEEYLHEYSPTAEKNDELWLEFADGTNRIPFLKQHRDWVESNQWGFGDRAFHYMWYLLLSERVFRGGASTSLLEIGVYKGQVLSLWAMLAKHCGATARITGVSPLSGNLSEPLLHKLRVKLDPFYRHASRNGNLYARDDYRECINTIFKQFDLPVDQIRIVKGKSQEARVKDAIGSETFDVVYIDGDHSYAVSALDMAYYGDLLKPGGFLVLDDASCFQPGSKFFKGHEEVSRAAEEIDKAKFQNILNVGHNRVYARLAK